MCHFNHPNKVFWKNSYVLLISLICHTPILLCRANMSTGALFHDEIEETTGIGVSL